MRSLNKDFGIILNSRDGRQIFYGSFIDEDEVSKAISSKDFKNKLKELDIKDYIIVKIDGEITKHTGEQK